MKSSSINCTKGNQHNRPLRPPHCQLCRTQGHYASTCPTLASYANFVASSDDNLAHAQCHSSTHAPYWYVDSGASDHMTASPDGVLNPTPPKGNEQVIFGNGKTLPVSHTGNMKLLGSLNLNNVLVVPNITKNLLSISKLTEHNNVDVLFSYPNFFIQDRQTKRVLARGCREEGLYVLNTNHEALVASPSCPKASYEIWHSRLGHVSFDIITMLQKLGHLSVTSIRPLAQRHRMKYGTLD
ncbi:hypothetical protein QVD17_19987 [Tagetes erecta]|uniref:GAG-pre-integrase domain-containing protein n=1 Tax=Tagetes erecta TaxID=13708 RepID=A0AAD8NWZ1_TARER|nr:hypothetical protein QVD17_19987 [Tagetes erecta]